MQIALNTMNQKIKHKGQLCKGDLIHFQHTITASVTKVNRTRGTANIYFIGCVHDADEKLVFTDGVGWCRKEAYSSFSSGSSED